MKSLTHEPIKFVLKKFTNLSTGIFLPNQYFNRFTKAGATFD